MRALLAVAALLLPACYAPDLRPCTVRCTPGETCPNDMTCAADNYCHASDDTSVCSGDTFKLTIMKSGSGGGTVTDGHSIQCGPQCTANLAAGTQVTLTAIAQGGSRLSAWTGAPCTGTDACTFSLQSDLTVGAVFNLGVALDLTFVGNGAGRVTSAPPGLDCTNDCTVVFDLGTSVTLTATPEGQSTFVGFSGDCTGLTCKLTLDQTANVTVDFE